MARSLTCLSRHKPTTANGARHLRTLIKNGKDHVTVDNPIYDQRVSLEHVELQIQETLNQSPPQRGLKETLERYVELCKKGQLVSHFSSNIIQNGTLCSDRPILDGVFFTTGYYGGTVAYHCDLNTLSADSKSLLSPKLTPLPVPISRCSSEFWVQCHTTKVPISPLIVGVVTDPSRLRLYPGGPIVKNKETGERIARQTFSALQQHYTVAQQESLYKLMRLTKKTMPKLTIPSDLASSYTAVPNTSRVRGIFPYTYTGEFVTRYLNQIQKTDAKDEIYRRFREQGDREIFNIAKTLPDPYIEVHHHGATSSVKITDPIPATRESFPKTWYVFQYQESTGFEFLGTEPISSPESVLAACITFFDGTLLTPSK